MKAPITGNNERLKIFVASPNEVAEERNIVSLVVEELRRLPEIIRVDVEVVRWETHSWPDVGDDPQDVINREIGEYDIFLGIMWRKFGTPTKRASSGTYEEFKRAYDYYKKYNRPHIMFYFRETPFYPQDLIELAQFRKVLQFKNEIEKLGVLYWKYNLPIDFERSAREHLIRKISNYTAKNPLSEKAQSVTDIKERSLRRKSRTLKLFLAYSHGDSQKVRDVYSILKTNGFDPWLDEMNLLPGQQWKPEIRRAIRGSDLVLLCISSSSVNKKGYFQKELRDAVDIALMSSDTFIIPVRLDEGEVPFIISNYQSLDYFQPDGPERLVNLLRAIKVRKETLD
jgi:hypothetical protein